MAGGPGFCSSTRLLCSAKHRAPRPIAFRLRGQDPFGLILALGDLQWARGPSLSSLFLPSYLAWFSCPGEVKRDPSYPPLADSPSLPTPSRIGRMASWQEGGGGDSFSAPLGWSTLFPFLPPGSCFCFSFVLFTACVFWCFDSLRVLLARVVCLFVCLFACLSVCLFFSFFRWCSYARPWFLIRELGELWLAFLSTRGPASCSCSVLLVCLFVFVALRRVVSFLPSSLLELLG